MNAEKKSGGVHEFFRKKIVALKRNPSIIPLVLLAVSFLVYSLNLTLVSNTTAKIQSRGMGLCEFCMMLMNLLAFVCLMNSFPRRKKPNIPMIALLFVMFAVILYANVFYCNAVTAAITRETNPIPVNESTAYITKSVRMLKIYRVLLVITAAAVATLPIYGKLIRKINTSVHVEDNGDMEKIEILD